MASRNPFRTPTVTPTPTGASSSSIPNYFAPPEGPPPPHLIVQNPGNLFEGPTPSRASSASPVNNGPPEELPELHETRSSSFSRPSGPPSSPIPPPLPPRVLTSPIVTRTDSLGPPSGSPPPPPLPARITVEPPPEHSFELPPSPPPSSDVAPPAYTPTPDPWIGESTVEFGPRRPFQRPPPAPASDVWGIVPPLHPPPTLALTVPSAETQVRSQPSSPQRPQVELSEFAREFYAAGGGQPQPDTPQPRFAPPPGEPPRRASSAAGSGASSAAGSGASSSSRAGPSGGASNDGRPTATPTPGHPLLNHGKILVYPAGYNCEKCYNTGYKNHDPTHPCRKDWDRYSRTYSSIFAYSPWGASAGDSRSKGWVFQRPLPTFTPPQASISVGSSSYLTPPGAPQHRRTVSQPQQPPVTRTLARPVAVAPGMRPPPGATVLRPGDPRIGGRLCWRCGGRGMTPFLIFDELPCETCGGMGRTF